MRFALRFTLVTNAAELWEIRREHELGANPFDAVSLCITALDFAKQDHVLEELERSAWDLVIIDEAHHCVGFGMSVAGEYLSQAAGRSAGSPLATDCCF